jgi:hypothetical protein
MDGTARSEGIEYGEKKLFRNRTTEQKSGTSRIVTEQNRSTPTEKLQQLNGIENLHIL